MRRHLLVALALGLSLVSVEGRAATWVPDHIVIVIEENRSASQIFGNPDMPYLNSLAQNGAKMTNAHFAQTPYGIIPAGWKRALPSRPSQPNYLYLFAGDNQGIVPEWFQDPSSPYKGTADMKRDGSKLAQPIHNTAVGINDLMIPQNMRPFTTPNMGSTLLRSGHSFALFSESLTDPHFDDAKDALAADNYRRKHNPVVNWINLPGRRLDAAQSKYLLPVSTNLGFNNTVDTVDHRKYRGFAKDADGKPLDYAQLPTVSIVVPNEQDDGHSNSDGAADAWLQKNIKPYADWAMTHNSLLIVTYDEDGSTDESMGEPRETSIDRIATVFYGAGVKKGQYSERIDHLNVLSTILDRYGLLGQFRREFKEAYKSKVARHEYDNLRPITDIFGEGRPLR